MALIHDVPNAFVEAGATFGLEIVHPGRTARLDDLDGGADASEPADGRNSFRPSAVEIRPADSA
ncbi:MAG TPA: hypothetical protein VEW26_12220 [Allosphingosinicella sp.]|nr:hypothetical protein [Allosphingosinicella sp.]